MGSFVNKLRGRLTAIGWALDYLQYHPLVLTSAAVATRKWVRRRRARPRAQTCSQIKTTKTILFPVLNILQTLVVSKVSDGARLP